MERLGRKPFQGTLNIIRFNWHFFVMAIITAVLIFYTSRYWPPALQNISRLTTLVVFLSILIPLTVSWFIYDHSDLYSFTWLEQLQIPKGQRIANIHAGFDETSDLLASKLAPSAMTVLDFYDPDRHTEVSIKRARKAYPPFPGTKVIQTDNVPLAPQSLDLIFLVFAAHEIRTNDERILFFKQLASALTLHGRIIVTEHLRDRNNFLAYNFGAFHFLSRSTWHHTFSSSGFQIQSSIKVNPFITTFILTKKWNCILK